MALTPIEQVRLLIGLTPSSPFIDIVNLTDEEVQFFLDTYGSPSDAAKQAAIAVSFQVAGINTREITGDIHVYNELSKQYLKALDNIISGGGGGGGITLPNGLMPYASGISWEDMEANNANPDNVRSPLTKVKACDSDIVYGGFVTNNSRGY